MTIRCRCFLSPSSASKGVGDGGTVNLEANNARRID